ncbi:hypothetical protein DEO72_LG2g4006 [Vigna unguiculata]|uniref:Uncharacterized protein n=1 Tax=Vigna unguiculata TaxID=3917 RepID=A0A4D6L599_VIGUN|nr:hypothetical protein DEO72_LG2g4006 [Vigna unguiculata]
MRNRLTMNPCTYTPISGFYDKLPSGHAHPPGDASQIGSVLMFCVIWIDSDRNTGNSKEWLSGRDTGSGKESGVGRWYAPPGGAGLAARRRRRGRNTALTI